VSTSEAQVDRRRLALFVALSLPLASLLVVASAIERPFVPVRRSASNERRAAVAIRDDVIPFQKWGTRLFTLPSLESAYERVSYFTQTAADDRRAAFVEAIRVSANACDVVDVFLLAHGNRFVDWVAALEPAVTAKLRLVYDTGCGDVAQAERWIALGADAYVGHVGLSTSPVFYVYFLRRWVAGRQLATAVQDSNGAAETILRVAAPPFVGRDGVDALVAGSRAELAGRGELSIGSR